MGKKREEGRGKREEAAEKVITGSGADVKQIEYDQGMVKCKCIVPCVWRGYRDEGDTVWIEREMIEKDAFIRMHFKAVEPLPEGQRRQDGDEDGGEGAGGGENADAGSDNADGDELFKNSVKGPQGDPKGAPGENAEGDDERGEDASSTDEGQGELDLK